MAFRLPTATDIKNRTATDALTDSAITGIITAHADDVTTFKLTDSQKHEFIIELVLVTIKYDGLRRVSRGDFQVEKDFNSEVEMIRKRMYMLDFENTQTGLNPADVPRLHWYSAYKLTSNFVESDFTDVTSGKMGQGNSVTFNEFTGNNYIAIATSEPLTSLHIGGNLNQIASFPLQGNIEIDGQPFNLYVSDSLWLPVAGTSTFTVGV